jgi:hypothetical protein
MARQAMAEESDQAKPVRGESSPGSRPQGTGREKEGRGGRPLA